MSIYALEMPSLPKRNDKEIGEKSRNWLCWMANKLLEFWLCKSNKEKITQDACIKIMFIHTHQML
jgi:hypothetical protein